jgi:hypothetical protein
MDLVMDLELPMVLLVPVGMGLVTDLEMETASVMLLLDGELETEKVVDTEIVVDAKMVVVEGMEMVGSRRTIKNFNIIILPTVVSLVSICFKIILPSLGTNLLIVH